MHNKKTRHDIKSYRASLGLKNLTKLLYSYSEQQKHSLSQ